MLAAFRRDVLALQEGGFRQEEAGVIDGSESSLLLLELSVSW